MARYDAQDVLAFVLNCDAQNTTVTLAIVTHITGGTLRAPGTLMAVTPQESFGYISAGCVDGDIIAQGRDALRTLETRNLRYGEGSSFRDIVLPCGGSIDLTLIPIPDRDAIQSTYHQLIQRKPAKLVIGGLEQTYAPRLKLNLIGRGAPLFALADLAQSSGFDLHVMSPDEDASRLSAEFTHLTSPTQVPDAASDPWSAVVFLFHDHDWEPALLQTALKGDAFYIGAMGSARTHTARVETLKANGVDIDDIQRIHGPIGLLPAMRDAHLLAVSILSEIVQVAQVKGRI